MRPRDSSFPARAPRPLAALVDAARSIGIRGARRSGLVPVRTYRATLGRAREGDGPGCGARCIASYGIRGDPLALGHRAGSCYLEDSLHDSNDARGGPDRDGYRLHGDDGFIASVCSTGQLIRAGSSDERPQNPAEKLAPGEQKGLRPQEIKDALYKILRRDHALRDPRWPFLITVRDVEGDTLVAVTFRHRSKADNREFDLVIQAKRAILHVDLTGKAVYAILEEPEHQGIAPIDGSEVVILDQVLKIPVPPGNPFGTQESMPAKPGLSPQQQADLAAECLRRVNDTHGTENVWAVAGYRIGAARLRSCGCLVTPSPSW